MDLTTSPDILGPRADNSNASKSGTSAGPAARHADNTSLGLKMHNRAQRDRLPADHPMRTAAVQFAKACAGYFAEPKTVECPEFLRAWTRARLAWCKYTGEPLI